MLGLLICRFVVNENLHKKRRVVHDFTGWLRVKNTYAPLKQTKHTNVCPIWKKALLCLLDINVGSSPELSTNSGSSQTILSSDFIVSLKIFPGHFV